MDGPHAEHGAIRHDTVIMLQEYGSISVLLEQVVFKMFLGRGLEGAEGAAVVRNWRRNLSLTATDSSLAFGRNVARLTLCLSADRNAGTGAPPCVVTGSPICS